MVVAPNGKKIKLDFGKTEGYIIERNNDPDTKGQLLSEGEKTAIAFVYFINKLHKYIHHPLLAPLISQWSIAL